MKEFILLATDLKAVAFKKKAKFLKNTGSEVHGMQVSSSKKGLLNTIFKQLT